MNDETVMAYVDGELTPEVAETVELAMMSDPSSLGRAVAYLRSRRLVRAAALADGLPSVSPSVVAAIDKASVPVHRPRWPYRLALAACLVIGALGGGAATGLLSRAPAATSIFGGIDAAPVAAVLGQEPTGGNVALDGGQLRVVGSHRLPDGILCREVTVTRDSRRTDLLACREAKDWALRVAWSPPPVEAASYRPAGDDSPIEAYLRETGAEAPLSREDEAAALAR